MRSRRSYRRSTLHSARDECAWETGRASACASASTPAEFRVRLDSGANRDPCRAACDHTDDHPLAINAAHLEMSQFGASYAGAIERHQQCPAKQCSGCVDQTGHFLPAQHRWQSTLVLWVRQEIAELVTLERLHEEEAQRRSLIDHGTGCQLALSQ